MQSYWQSKHVLCSHTGEVIMSYTVILAELSCFMQSYADCKLLDIEFDSMWESRRDATTFSNIFDVKLRFETGR